MSSELEGPAWAREALGKALTIPQRPSVTDHRGGTAWPLLVAAATMPTFLPRELAPDALSGSERREAEKAVLNFAELSDEPEGARWSLTRDARRAVLAECGADEIASAARGGRPDDRVTSALQQMVGGTATFDLEHADMPQLEAMRLAAGWLSGVATKSAPPLDELDREIELRRLLAPFERMTGKTAGADGADRFFGRDDDIEDLREYVGVVAADSVGRGLKRVVKRARRIFTGRKPKSVWGAGGVGKTTLIAKFMLEHARAAQSRFPFAYLDFDRSTISANNRAGLLAEMSRQVGAQFPNVTAEMTQLRDDLARVMQSTTDDESISVLMSYAWQFRQIIDRSFADDSPFLLVFDTFEIVQYGSDQVAALEELIYAFYGNAGWPRLRLIISGRQRVETFLNDKTEERELGALDYEGSVDMLVALAADAQKPVPRQLVARLVTAIVEAVRDPSGSGVRPLRLKLIGQEIAAAKGTAPEIVQSLLAELAKPAAEQATFARLFIDGILVRRILNHVRDARVRALSDPGLVVRRITRDVIRDVMTRGTQKPDGVDRSTADPAQIEPWIVTDAEAQDIFDEFAREVSLVEPEGSALRHRQDVRQDMLPLIRASRPNGFARIHRLAFDYFSAQAKKNANDVASRAEAVYHGLWLGMPLDEVDALWPADSDPRIDPAEFGELPLANTYLRAKHGDPLMPEEIERLPRETVNAWLAARSDELLSTVRILEQVDVVRAAGGGNYENFDSRPELAATVARLLYRAGLWRETMKLAERHVQPKAAYRAKAMQSLLRTWATIGVKSASQLDVEPWFANAVGRVTDLMAKVELAAHATIAWDNAAVFGLEALPVYRSMLASFVADVQPVQWRRDARILRLVMTAGAADRDMLLTYAGVTSRLPHDVSVAAILTRMRGKQTALEEIDKVWEKEKARLVRSKSKVVLEGLRELAAADHSDWLVPFGNAISRAFAARGRKQIIAVARESVSKTRRPEVDRMHDGHSLLQVIVSDGTLMSFAEKLGRTVKGSGYPESAAEMAAALTRWHRLTVGEERWVESGDEVIRDDTAE